MTFVSDLEEIEAISLAWAHSLVNQIIEILVPDDRPFHYKPQTQEEKLTEYMTVRGQLQGWIQWITQLTGEIMQKLHEVGLSEQVIYQCHPWDIAARLAIDYSYNMEKDLVVK